MQQALGALPDRQGPADREDAERGQQRPVEQLGTIAEGVADVGSPPATPQAFEQQQLVAGVGKRMQRLSEEPGRAGQCGRNRLGHRHRQVGADGDGDGPQALSVASRGVVSADCGAVAAGAGPQHRDRPSQPGQGAGRRRRRRQVRKVRRSRRQLFLWHQAFLADGRRGWSPRRGIHPPAGRRCRPAGPDRLRETDRGDVARLLLPARSSARGRRPPPFLEVALGRCTAGAGWGLTIMAGRRTTGLLGRRLRAYRRGWLGRRRWSRHGPGQGTAPAGCAGGSGRRRRRRA
jgi:hypothetical protein